MNNKAKSVWIVNPYGTLPGEGWRRYRSENLANAFTAAGWKVCWFIAQFEHREKRLRSHTIDVDYPYEVELIETPSYPRNLSVRRLIFEYIFGRNFIQKAKERPDTPSIIILLSPSLPYGTTVAKYCRKERIFLITDVLDLWPEQFLTLFPRHFRRTFSKLLAPIRRLRNRTLEMSDGVIYCSTEYQSIIESHGITVPSTVAYIGCDVVCPGSGELSCAYPSARVEGTPLRVVYSGTLGETYDLDVIFKAADLIARRNLPIAIEIVGAGPLADRCRDAALRLPDVMSYQGRLTPDELPNFYRGAHVGLATYKANSMVSMPLKVFDYFASGLLVGTSLGGEIAKYIKSEGVGFTYPPGNHHELVSQLTQFLQDPGRLEDMQTKALSLANRFSAEAQSDIVVQFCEKIYSRESQSQLSEKVSASGM